MLMLIIVRQGVARECRAVECQEFTRIVRNSPAFDAFPSVFERMLRTTTIEYRETPFYRMGGRVFG